MAQSETIETPFRVEKQGYSRGAWRVLDADGRQVFRDEVFHHPMLDQDMVITAPVCFERKRDALAWVAAQAAMTASHAGEVTGDS